MLKDKKIIWTAIFIVLALILYESVATAGWEGVMQEYIGGGEESFQSNMEDWSNEQLIEEIDLVAVSVNASSTLLKESSSSGTDINVLIPFVAELFKRKDQFNDTELLSSIGDRSKQIITREIFVDMYAMKHETGNDEELKQLLRGNEIDYQIKSRIVAVANFTMEDIDLLKELIQEDDGVLAFNSLKRLSKIKVVEAFRISEDILDNLDNESNDKISAALKATAKYLGNENYSSNLRDKNLESDFIDLCFNIIKSSDDPILRDSAFFAVSEIGSQNAITKIIEDWHAGLWDEPSSTSVLPIMHAPGPGSVLQWDSWEDFLNGNNFMGTYKPNKFASSSMRDAFVAMGRNLRTEKVPYNLAYQVYYNHSSASNYVHYDEITSMRCDGVVEYIYEWYSYRVYGNDSRWDVTKNDVLNREQHSGTAITPKKQVNYLVEI
ncbi:hypothetical protein D3C74_37140 [compost metagenome]